jgi:multiple sugar transport system substrate-binding protein
MKRGKIQVASTAVAAIALAAGMVACSGSTGTGASPDSVLDSKAMENPGKGTITWCAQKDSSGSFAAVVDAFNKQYPDGSYSLKLLEFPENTDEWRNQFVQRQSAKSSECDIFGSDVTWTAEFANKGFLMDLTPYVKDRADQFIASTLETAKYQDKYWGVPFGTNVGFMFHRTDQIATAPTTWQEVFAAGKANNGYLYQASSYEGLTVDFMEIASAAGGKVLSDDGKSSVINSPENLKALTLMVDGIKSGSTPKAILTYTEEPSRRAWEAGDASLLRNWTYAYVLGEKNPAIAGKFDITPLPKWEGGKASSILGGVNMVISKYSKNAGAALKAVDFITSEASQVTAAVKGGQSATLKSAYDNQALQTALPFHDVLEKGIEQATTRPVTPVYSQVSAAMYKNISAALSGSVTPEEALKSAEGQINEALSTF